MPAKKGTRRSFRTKSHTAKPQKDQELIDDQKCQQKLESKRFTERIEREANEAILCPNCFSSDWRMKPKYLANWVANELVATMVCRKCKRSVLFGTHLEEEYREVNGFSASHATHLSTLFGQHRLLNLDSAERCHRTVSNTPRGR